MLQLMTWPLSLPLPHLRLMVITLVNPEKRQRWLQTGHLQNLAIFKRADSLLRTSFLCPLQKQIGFLDYFNLSVRVMLITKLSCKASIQGVLWLFHQLFRFYLCLRLEKLFLVGFVKSAVILSSQKILSR